MPSCHTSPFPSGINQNEKRNVILIGWDGVRRDLLLEFLKQDKLPNLKFIMDSGSYVQTRVNVDVTHTKPGWAQILSGYDSTITHVYSNRDYQSIPKGLTVFERLKNKFGKDFYTAFISGKVANTGARGPHKICINCESRFKDTLLPSFWQYEYTKADVKYGKKRIFEDRSGEPFYNALTAIDYYKNALEEWPSVMREADNLLEKLKGRHFFVFIHFLEPDRYGHMMGGDSKEYREALLMADKNLGKILHKLKDLDMAKNTVLFLTTDHGFSHGFVGNPKLNHQHDNEPDTFLVSTLKSLKPHGDRRDFAPTLLDFYDLSPDQFKPAMSGRSLLIR